MGSFDLGGELDPRLDGRDGVRFFTEVRERLRALLFRGQEGPAATAGIERFSMLDLLGRAIRCPLTRSGIRQERIDPATREVR